SGTLRQTASVIAFPKLATSTGAADEVDVTVAVICSADGSGWLMLPLSAVPTVSTASALWHTVMMPYFQRGRISQIFCRIFQSPARRLIRRLTIITRLLL